MKAIVTTVLMNLGWSKFAEKRDALVQAAERKTKVEAAFPSCGPSV
jgi:hypothetical protein